MQSWRFHIAMEQTKAYSQQELQEHCTCGYCRNFYETVDAHYPKLRPFLAQFGVEIFAPAELIPYEVDREVWYDAAYVVAGEILQTDSRPIQVHDLTVTITDGMTNVNCDLDTPFFVLYINRLTLPWMLPEPLSEVVSPIKDMEQQQRLKNYLYNENDPFTLS